jgi:zinc protease
MIYYKRGSETDELGMEDLKEGLFSALDKIGKRQKVLAIPPDFTRKHSFAGPLTGLAEKYFGGIAAQDPPQAIRTVEPEQLGARRLLVEIDSPTPLLHMTFHAGAATDPETLPLSVLLSILVGGDSSRLHRLFVEEEQVALTVGGFQMEGFDPGLVYFYLTLPPGADVPAVEGWLLDELEKIAREGITVAELEKARNIMIADYWRGLATINGKASALGNAEVFLGDYQRAFSLPDELALTSAEQIQQVARAVFDQKKMTVGILRSPAEEDEQ